MFWAEDLLISDFIVWTVAKTLKHLRKNKTEVIVIRECLYRLNAGPCCSALRFSQPAGIKFHCSFPVVMAVIQKNSPTLQREPPTLKTTLK